MLDFFAVNSSLDRTTTDAMSTVTLYIAGVEDKRVSNWLFMSTFWPTFSILIVYLSLIYVILPAYMKNRKPFKLTGIIKAYNIFQIVSCVGIIYWVATSGWVQGHLYVTCPPIGQSVNTQYAIDLLRAFHLTYFLKISELVETIFFVLRKKYNQVSRLHVYHHGVTVTMGYLACKYSGNGMTSIPIMVNSFIHILMYSYYYMASLGPEWQKTLAPWKPRLTLLQMVQFTGLLIHVLTATWQRCEIPGLIYMVYVPNVLIIYKMFYDFYRASYNKSKQTKTAMTNGHLNKQE